MKKKKRYSAAPGARAAESALSSGATRRLLVAEGMRSRRVMALAQDARTRGIPVEIVSEAELKRLSGSARHQGVAAEVAEPPRANWGALLRQCEETPPLLIGLDSVSDPRNLGAILRTARAFGADGVFAPRNRCAPLSPATRKAAAGAAEVLPYFLVGNLARALEELRERNVILIGADSEAEEDIFQAAKRANPKQGWCWMLGGEGEGLRRLTREKCDAVARIPTVSGSDGCLNVSVACGACLTAWPGRGVPA